MRTSKSNLNLLQVTIVAALSGAAVQLVPHVGTAWAEAPKSSVDTKQTTVSPKDQGAMTKAGVGAGGKPSFYMRKGAARFLGSTGGIVEAECDDKDDIAFNATCYSADNARIQSERMVRWTTDDAPAVIECRIFNDNTPAIDVEAHIFCMPYDAEQ